MKGQDDLMGLLAEWRRLTNEEGLAIENEDWKDLAQRQHQKKLLQEKIDSLGQFQSSAEALTGRAPARSEVARLVSELQGLEGRNLSLLQTKRQSNRLEWNRLNQSLRTIHGLRRAYGAPAARGYWQSYS